MKSIGILLLVSSSASSAALVTAHVVEAAEPVARWIAAPGDAAGGQAYFRKRVEISQPVTAARLVAAGRGAGAECFLDGKFLCEFDPYDPLLKLDLTPQFSRGSHLLAVRCRGATADAAFFLRVQLKLANGQQDILVTDRSWQCNAAPPAGWMTSDSNAKGWRESAERAAVDERLLTPDARRIDLAASDNYEQWRQASGAKEGTDPALFSVAPGFRIERVRSAAPGEDSWISLVFDPQGRAIISQEQQGLLRMTLAKDGSAVERVERINDDLKEVRGMVFLGSDLFANANNSRGLYRLRGDGKGNFAKPELLLATEGGVGHGRNSLTVGPDGKIYSIHGDDVRLLKSAQDWTRGRGESRPTVRRERDISSELIPPAASRKSSRPDCAIRSASRSIPTARCSPTTPMPNSTWAHPGIDRPASTI